MSSLIVEICKVDSVEKHPNADRLEIVGIKGFNCITGLGNYKVGDLVTFVPPDCIIPENLIEKYKLEYLKGSGRTTTVKLRGFLSQGLILDVPEGRWKVGDDVASILGITKWSPPEAPVMKGIKQTSKKKINPLFDKYTDIENVKHYQDVFKNGDMVVVLEKIHGSNSRFSRLPIAVNDNASFFEKLEAWIRKNILNQKYTFVYGSHNVQITNHSNRKSFYSEDIWGKIAKRFDFANIIPNDYIVYGEIFGDGIQDLTYGLKNEIDFMVFDVKYKNQYMNWSDVVEFCNKLNLPVVPVLYIGEYYEGLLSEYTTGNTTLNVKQIREGVIIKSLVEDNDLKIGRKILKSISPDYLLRKNATEYS